MQKQKRHWTNSLDKRKFQYPLFVSKNSTYDFYDHTGKKLNAESYFSVVNFSEGICALQLSSTSAPQLADRNFKKSFKLYKSFPGCKCFFKSNHSKWYKSDYLNRSSTSNNYITYSNKSELTCLCIDIFSKCAAVVLMISKQGPDVAAGILQCLKEMNGKPKIINTDDETSFSS